MMSQTDERTLEARRERREKCASEEKRRQAVELFRHGIGYTRASRFSIFPSTRFVTGAGNSERAPFGSRFPAISTAIRRKSGKKSFSFGSRVIPGTKSKKALGFP